MSFRINQITFGSKRFINLIIKFFQDLFNFYFIFAALLDLKTNLLKLNLNKLCSVCILSLYITILTIFVANLTFSGLIF